MGINIPKSILDISENDYDTLMNANLKSAFFQTRYFTEAKTHPKAGDSSASIIHISSQMGHVGGENRGIYCASKHALEDLYGAVVYLASDSSSLVTGSALKVDGGGTAH